MELTATEKKALVDLILKLLDLKVVYFTTVIRGIRIEINFIEHGTDCY